MPNYIRILTAVEALLVAMKADDLRPSEVKLFDEFLDQVKQSLRPGMETLVQQARGLSSGTLASLTKLSHYDEIEPIQADFVDWCTRRPQYDTWIEAWQDYWLISQYNKCAYTIVQFIADHPETYADE